MRELKELMREVAGREGPCPGCVGCQGSAGIRALTSPAFNLCKGTCRTRLFPQLWEECGCCDGRGGHPKTPKPCDECDGSGKVVTDVLEKWIDALIGMGFQVTFSSHDSRKIATLYHVTTYLWIEEEGYIWLEAVVPALGAAAKEA